MEPGRRVCFNRPARMLTTPSQAPFSSFSPRDRRSPWLGDSAESEKPIFRKTSDPKRVLVIEDHPDSARSLAILIRSMGHEADYAINGYVGLALMREFRPDVVLLDLGLPGLTGFEVCARIKADPNMQRVRVIAVTAYPQDHYRLRSAEAGFDLHLLKPVPIRVLEDLLG